MAKLISTLIGVVIAVGLSSGLWIGANLILNQATKRYQVFSSLIAALLGALLMVVLDGNRLLTGLVARPSSFFNGDDPGLFTGGFGDAVAGHLFWPVVGAAVGAVLGWVMGSLEERRLRLAVAMGGLAVCGVVLSTVLRTRHELDIQIVPLVVWTGAFAALGVVLAQLRGRDRLLDGLTGASIGWMLGAFGGAVQGVAASTQVETTLAFVVTGLLVGARWGLAPLPDISKKAKIDDSGRAWLFVGPAVGFIAVMLIIPALQTFLLSVQDDDAPNVREGFVGLDNYRTVFDDPKNLSVTGVETLFTSSSATSTSWFPWGGSALLPWVLFFAVVGVVLALLLGRETGQRFNVNGSPVFAFLLSIGLFSFALFTHLRGTIINNLWWVLAVTLLSTSMGLAVAKLSDGARYEAVAKSFVFMPMALSMVGASIIWRLIMYQARDVSKDQTGVLNALWVWLGRQTTEWGVGKVVIGAIFLLAAAALAWAAIRTVGSSPSTGGLYAALAVIPLWVGLRTYGDGIGGYAVTDSGEIRPLAVNFVQGVPYNNFWLMVILIWIQTGFAMVILSAAIKAVPNDYIEAAKIDGATDGQVFWRITIPSIAPTIGVVATTIMVNVMKVFDIVKVTTNGQFDSQVLANAMFTQAFQFFNQGVGAALAILLFVGIFPIMVLNIIRLTREEA